MLRGLAISAAGMSIESQRLDVIAQNLANVDTPGYQRQVLTAKSFVAQLSSTLTNLVAQPVTPPVRPDSLAITSSLSYDTSENSLHATGNQLDFALPAQAFFAVRQPDGSEVATRNGAFMLNDQHQLVTVSTNGAEHCQVLGQGGPVTINGSHWEINRQGAIVVDGKTVDQLKIMSYGKTYPTAPVQLGNGFVNITGAQQVTNLPVSQGMLNGSNVNPVSEMISMIAATRLFEANQKCVQAQDETLNHAVNDVGHV